MADISKHTESRMHQAIVRAELDQEVREAWEMLYERGEDWTDRFLDLITELWELNEQPERAVGLLAHIGWLHMLESFHPEVA